MCSKRSSMNSRYQLNPRFYHPYPTIAVKTNQGKTLLNNNFLDWIAYIIDLNKIEPFCHT